MLALFGNMRTVFFKFILRQFLTIATPILGTGKPHVHNACLSFKYIYFRNYFRSFIKQAIVFSFKILIFSSKHNTAFTRQLLKLYCMDKALSWASNLADISDEDISIIKHARKSLLFKTVDQKQQ